jgi:hypothetical protein
MKEERLEQVGQHRVICKTRNYLDPLTTIIRRIDGTGRVGESNHCCEVGNCQPTCDMVVNVHYGAGKGFQVILVFKEE